MIKRNNQTNETHSNFCWKTKLAKPQRLATVQPKFDIDDMVEAETAPQTLRASQPALPTKPHLPVIPPASKPNNQPVSNEPSLSTQEVADVKPQISRRVRGKHFPYRAVAIATSFAIVLGAFVWVFASQINTSKKSATAAKPKLNPVSQPSADRLAVASASTESSARRAERSTAWSPATATPMIRLPLIEEPSQPEIQPEQAMVLAEALKQDPELVEPQVAAKEELEQAQVEDVPDAPLDEQEVQPRPDDKVNALLAKVFDLMGPSAQHERIKDALSLDKHPAPEPIARPKQKKLTEIDAIQKLNADRLRAMLQKDTLSVDLFHTKGDFDKAKNFLVKQTQKTRERRTIAARTPKTLEDIAKAILEKDAAAENNLLQEPAPFEPLIGHLFERDDLQALPLTMGEECRVGAEDAAAISSVSSSLGRLVSEASAGPIRLILLNSDNAALRSKMIKVRQDIAITTLQAFVAESASHPQFLKTTDQILQVQHPRDRLELINTLKGADNDTATNLLANRAKYDLSSDVRLAATNALAKLPRDQYRAELLEGLQYPWHIVAQHSAEALVRLDDKEAIPELVAMLDLPHPSTPIETEQDEYTQPTLVAINHMRNCLLCHAPSQSSGDVATGVVPNWDRPIQTQYYARSKSPSVSVRADITYLKQDFSVVQPVAKHGTWPNEQRFDYVVQQTPLKPSKAARVKKRLAKAKNLNREAIVYALQKLTNQSPKDDSSESWKVISDQLLDQKNGLLVQADNK